MTRNTITENIQEYLNENIIAFSCNINMEYNEKHKVFKKKPYMPFNWQQFTLNNTSINPKFNGIALVCGKVSSIIVLDIDNMDDYAKLLESENRKCLSRHHVCVKSGSGGMHVYFKYTDDLDSVKSKAHCFYKYKDLAIDIRSNKSCIYAPGTSYYNQNVNQMVSYEWINGDSVFDTELHPMPKWVKRLLLEEPVIETKNKIIKAVDEIDYSPILLNNTIEMTEEKIQDLLNCINPNKHSSYSDWLNIAFCISCEKRPEFYKYFLEFSKKQSNFSCDNDVLKQWNTCIHYNEPDRKKLTYNTLMYYARNDNKEAYNEFCVKYYKRVYTEEPDIVIDDTVNVTQEYLTTKNSIAMNSVSEYIQNIDQKNLIIKSPYSTGKTTMLQHINNDSLASYNVEFKTVLFVTYRITLAINLSGTFQDFELYNTPKNKKLKKLDYCKLICSIDSIHKCNDQYDLVIVDECESLLNYFSSETMIDKRNSCYESLQKLLNNSKKNVFLDGDITNRTKTFISQLNNSYTKYINNTQQKLKYNFQFVANNEFFNNEIDNCLESNLNVCIVSMSSSSCEEYYHKYKDIYNSTMYTGKSSDIKKSELANVNEQWNTKQLIIYSPSIESGLDFSIDHVHKIFVVLSASSNLKYSSTSQRGLMQMIARIRKFDDNNVMVYRRLLPIAKNIDQAYTFQEVKLFHESIFNEAIDESDNLKEMILYAKHEEINKLSNVFIPILIEKFIIPKGHTYEFIDFKNTKVTQTQHYIDSFINTSLEIDNLNEIIDKTVGLTEYELMVQDKFFAKTKYKVDFNTVDDYRKYYGKDLNIAKQLIFDKKDRLQTVNNTVNNKKHEIINKVFNYLNSNWKAEIKDNKYFETTVLVSDDINLTNEQVQIAKLMDNPLLFGHKKTDLSTRKAFLGRINAIMEDYLINITPKYKKTRIEKKQVKTIIAYKIKIDEHYLSLLI